MLRVGLTGGIGAGKSTVASALADLGAVVVDADRISREVVEPGTEGLAEIVAAFGEEVLDPDGALDRPALGRIVFADDALRARLNAIVHPRVGARTAELVEAAPDDAIVVHDVPLLVENGLGPAYALVVVVDAPVDVRVARLAESRGMSEDDARSRIAAQADDEARREAADVWIDNSGEPGTVRATVATLWSERIVPFEENLRAGRAVRAPADVVTPDPDWALQGRRLAARAAHACPGARVEHVGPTAVPGLPAPDVVDLLVVDDGAPAASDRAKVPAGRSDGREVPAAQRGEGAGDDPAAGGRDAGDPADADDRGSALARAGFPPLGPGEHGGADPARPVRLWFRSTAALVEARDRARAELSDGADPAAVRAAVGPA